LPDYYQARAVSNFEVGNVAAAVIDQLAADSLPHNYISLQGAALALSFVPFGRIAGSLGKVGGELRLFRAVSGTELADIASQGFRSPGGSLGMETKLFATSLADAARWGRELYTAGEPFYIVEARVARSVASRLHRFYADGRAAVAVYREVLGDFNSVVKVFNLPFIPWP
jgi:hypothetical protein